MKFFTLILKKLRSFYDEMTFNSSHSMWIKIIIRIYIRISFLSYYIDVNDLNNGRSNGIQINHSVKITNYN